MRTPLFLAALAGATISSTALAQGVEKLWADNCARCHGAGGKGGNAKSLLDNEWKYGGSDREIFDSIKQGRPDDGMVAFGETMTDQQVWGLVVYLHELREQDFRKREGNPKPDASGVYTSHLAKFKTEVVIPENAGLVVPWSVDWLPDGTTMLVTNRPGQVRVWKDGKLFPALTGTPLVRQDGQGGLMDVAVHPEYAKNGWVYLTFSEPRDGKDSGPAMTKVIRGRINDGAWVDQETVFQAKKEHYVSSGIHFGSRLVFKKSDDPVADGRYYLFFSIGERGHGDNAQNVTLPNGKVHRVWDDGKIPNDNPFVSTPGAYPSIYSFGHRNPQGLVLDLAGNLWETEHGPRGGDEVNLILKGRNYGWPLVSFSIDYNGAPRWSPWIDPEKEKALPGGPVMMPLTYWLPSIAACGLDCIRGDKFPGWSGDLVAGGLAGNVVDRFRFKLDGPPGAATGGTLVEHEELLKGIGRVRDTAVGPDGLIYVVLNEPDMIIRLVPAK
jgi:glucose/arabinose dehydrogenase